MTRRNQCEVKSVKFMSHVSGMFVVLSLPSFFDLWSQSQYLQSLTHLNQTCGIIYVPNWIMNIRNIISYNSVYIKP